jgi:streptomycin 6-kinase
MGQPPSAIFMVMAQYVSQLLEYANGNDLMVLVQQGKDEQATAIIATVLNRLHYNPATIDGLVPLERWFRDLFKKASTESSQSIWARGAEVTRDLLDHPQDVRVLHGDIHHRNIRCHPKRKWLAFDPKGLLGERTFDAANVLCNPVDMPELVADKNRFIKHAQILSEYLLIDLGRLLAFTFAYCCLSASWNLSANQDASLPLRVAEIAESYL